MDDYQASFHGFRGFLRFMGNLFSNGLNGLLDPGALIEETIETIQMLQGLSETVFKIGKILDSVNTNELGNVGDPSVNFTEAVQNAADMELKGPLFDKLELTSNIKLEEVDETTNGEIKCIADLQMAYSTTAKVGNRSS